MAAKSIISSADSFSISGRGIGVCEKFFHRAEVSRKSQRLRVPQLALRIVQAKPDRTAHFEIYLKRRVNPFCHQILTVIGLYVPVTPGRDSHFIRRLAFPAGDKCDSAALPKLL